MHPKILWSQYHQLTSVSPLQEHKCPQQQKNVLKEMPIGAFLVYDDFNIYLDSITIIKHVKTLDHQYEPVIQKILTFRQRCMIIRLVNNMGTLIPSILFMETTTPKAHTWVLNKYITTFPNMFTPHQEPAPYASTTSLYLNINMFQNFSLCLQATWDICRNCHHFRTNRTHHERSICNVP